MCNRVLLLFGKLQQWNLHVNCHVTGRIFRSSLRSKTGLSSLWVSCKRTLNEIYVVSKTVLYFFIFECRCWCCKSRDVNAEIYKVGRYMVTSWNSAWVEISSQTEIFLGYMNTSTHIENKNFSTEAELKNTICSMVIRHDT